MPLQLIRDDLLHFKVDAIVNSANPKPRYRPGVDQTIYQQAGGKLLEDRLQIGPMEISQVELTSAYSLKCKYIIHTVSPYWIDGTYHEKEQLRACYENCLELALEKKLNSIAFPLLASGNNQFPKDQALKIALNVFESFLLKHDLMIYLALYDKESYQISNKLFGNIQSYIDDNYIQEKLCGTGIRSFNTITLDSSLPVKNHNFKVESTFQEHLFYLIDSKGLDDVGVYKKANMDKKLFSKIRSNKDYHPKKETVLALCISMKLSLDETKDLLMKAGYALSNANLMDVIIQYCIEEKQYDINQVNFVLFEYKQKPLGV